MSGVLVPDALCHKEHTVHKGEAPVEFDQVELWMTCDGVEFARSSWPRRTDMRLTDLWMEAALARHHYAHAAAEVARLRRVIAEYGGHLPDCPAAWQQDTDLLGSMPGACECGWHYVAPPSSETDNEGSA